MLNIDLEKCTGCGACVQRCPKQCISWTTKEFGFRYPHIDEHTCVKCGMCDKVCPINKKLVAPANQKCMQLFCWCQLAPKVRVAVRLRHLQMLFLSKMV